MASLSSPPSTGSSAPQSVEKISRLAQDYKFDPAVPLRYWLRTAATLVREVCILHEHGMSGMLIFQRLGSTFAKDTMNRRIYFCSAMPSWYSYTWPAILI
jgi:hypothetical protein